MKKIYLFSISLLTFLSGVVAQQPGSTNCPTQYNVIAWKQTVNTGTPHCEIILSTDINPAAEPGWSVSFIGHGGIPLNKWNDNPGDPTDFALTSTGDFNFIYDCFDGTKPELEYIRLKRVVGGMDAVVCQTVPGTLIVTPVKLTSFNGRLQNDNSVALDWTSVIETESYKYEVERSADGKYFEKVGNLNAAGNSVTSLRYTFTDDLPAAGAYFYRLKQIDFNGSFEYSKVVYINSKKGAGSITKVFPNPFQNTIQLVGATSSDLTPNNVQVMSISGQLMKYKVIGNAISIDPSAPNGLYIVKVKGQVFKLEKAPGKGSF